jgi:hypothetical protein
MRLKIVLVAALCMFTQGAHADTLDQIAGKSAFVTTTLKFLKSKRAVSVYASTKPYCPSAFWWSARPAADRDARRGFQKQITREMKQAGFPKASIDHCVENSGFVFKGLALTEHPKNTKYARYVQSGIISIAKRATVPLWPLPF